MLYKLIATFAFWPSAAAEPFRGAWTGAPQWLAWFLNPWQLIYAPGLMLAAPLCFGLQGLLASKTPSRRKKVLLAALVVPAYMVMCALGNTVVLPDAFELLGVVQLSVSFIMPTWAISVFAIWTPLFAVGLYTTLATRPRWWLSALSGAGLVLLAVWGIDILGVLAGLTAS